MYETYYHFKAKPFTLLPDPEFLYLGAKHKMALSLLEYGLTSGAAFIVIAGEPGTGKTTLLNRLLDQTRHPWTVGVLSNTHTGFGGLLPWIAASFDLPIADKRETDAFQAFTRFLERERSVGRRVLLVVDEAQNIGPTMLEELRLLSNLNDGRRRSLQILLSGQLGLLDQLQGPDMVQFAQRIGVEYMLDALSEEETLAYIAHRLEVAGRRAPLFTALAGRTVFRLTGGTPRLINQLCDHALVYGFAAQAGTITARIVLDTAAARNRHGVFPFKVSPESVEWSPRETDAEQAELETIRTRQVEEEKEGRPSRSSDPDDPAALYQEALALKEAGNYARAIALFDRLAEEGAWAVKALAQKAFCLNATGRYDESIGVLRTAISRPSASTQDRTAAEYLLGRTLEAMGRTAEAVALYRRLPREGTQYRDVEERIERLEGTKKNNRPDRSASSSWLSSLFRGHGSRPWGTRVQR
jgi:type II secretory pathway predicted ATPase ExeA